MRFFVITFNGFVWINQIVEANSLQIWLFSAYSTVTLKTSGQGVFILLGTGVGTVYKWNGACIDERSDICVGQD